MDCARDLLAALPCGDQLAGDHVDPTVVHGVLAGVGLLEKHLVLKETEATLAAREVDPRVLLQGLQHAGISFCAALDAIIGGSLSTTAGASTLEDELAAFAAAVAGDRRGPGGAGAVMDPFSAPFRLFTSEEAGKAVACVWDDFKGVGGYGEYLRKAMDVLGADTALNGGAAWQRLLCEVEVAVRLARLPQTEHASRQEYVASQLDGMWSMWPQRREDVASQLMFAVVYDPLRQRARYVAARVGWAFRQLAAAAEDQMRVVGESESALLCSTLAGRHHALLRANPVLREVLFEVVESTAAAAAGRLFRSLEASLVAGCASPEVLLRPQTRVDLGPAAAPTGTVAGGCGTDGRGDVAGAAHVKCSDGDAGRKDEADAAVAKCGDGDACGDAGGGAGTDSVASVQRRRVREEMAWRRRDSSQRSTARRSAGLQLDLQRGFDALRVALPKQALALAGVALTEFRRRLEEGLCTMDFTTAQRQIVQVEFAKRQRAAALARERLEALRQCAAALRDASAFGM